MKLSRQKELENKRQSAIDIHLVRTRSSISENI